MKINPNGIMTDATFAKLLTAASDLAFEYSENGQDGYKITRRAFVEMLRDALPGRSFVEPHFHETPRIN
jgi:hypothetical protein